MKARLFGLLTAGVVLVATSALAQHADTRSELYTIAAQDVLAVTVLDYQNLSGKYTVGVDGTVQLPLVGKLQAAGMTIPQFEQRVTKAFADGYLKEPRISVSLEQFRGARVFVFGNVSAPGTYVLEQAQTLIEVLAKAGSNQAAEAVIVRPNQPTGGLTLPDQVSDGEVIRVNLRELEKGVEHGSLARNVVLKDGDTVFIPRVDPTRVFITGKVRTPGAYSITDGTTVLQALSLAGGITEEASVNRLQIMRLVEGKQKTLKAKLTDVLLPGDTLLVRERLF